MKGSRAPILFEGAGESAELGDREFLGARRRRDSGALQQHLRRDAKWSQAGSQHLAALTERGRGNPFERECEGIKGGLPLARVLPSQTWRRVRWRS